MVRESRHFAQDILDMIDVVHGAIEGKSFADFENDDLLRLGLERAIEIISEASRHIPDEMKAMRAEVPWPRIKAIGNILRMSIMAFQITSSGKPSPMSCPS